MRNLNKIILAVMLIACSQSCTFVRFNLKSMDWSKCSVPADAGHTTDSIRVADFKEVVSNIPAEITYRMCEGESSVVITAPENYQELITCEVDGDKLVLSVIDGKRLAINDDSKIRIELTSSVLEKVTVNGASELSIPEGLESKSFTLLVHGAADADIHDLKCSDANITIQGAGDIDVDGLEADNTECLIQGAGDICLSGRTDKARITVQGAGSIDIDDLEVRELKTNVRGLQKKR